MKDDTKKMPQSLLPLADNLKMETKPETRLDGLRAMRSASMQCYRFADRIEDALIADEAKRGADSGVESARIVRRQLTTERRYGH